MISHLLFLQKCYSYHNFLVLIIFNGLGQASPDRCLAKMTSEQILQISNLIFQLFLSIYIKEINYYEPH